MAGLRNLAAGGLGALAAVALAGAALGQAGLDFPQLSGRIVDEAGLLDASQRAAIETKLAAHETKTTDQIVVVTLRSLRGTSIEDYGNRLGRHWQIGQKDKNNGALLIVAPNERKVRIEVGYGLEGTLTDAISSTIVQTAVLPRFRAGDFPGGIARGVDAMIDVLTNDESEWKQRARPAPEETDWFVVLFFAALIVFYLYVFWRAIRQAQDARKRGIKRGRDFDVWTGPSSGGGWSGGSSSGGGWSGGGGSFGGGGSSGSW